MTIEKLQELAQVYTIRRFDKTNIKMSTVNSEYINKFIDFVQLYSISQETEISLKQETIGKEEVCDLCDSILQEYQFTKKVFLCPKCDVIREEETGYILLR